MAPRFIDRLSEYPQDASVKKQWLYESIELFSSTLPGPIISEFVSRSLITHALTLLNDVSVTYESNMPSAVSIEQATLLLASATKSPSISKDLVTLIFEDKHRNWNELQEKLHSVYQPSILGLYIAYFYPDCWKDIGMEHIGHDLSQYLTYGRSEQEEIENRIIGWAKDTIANDGIVQIPATNIVAKDVQHELSLFLGIPKKYQEEYGAVTIKEDQLIILARQDVSMVDLRHEKRHLDPGLSIGSLGHGLDEGFTEHLAIFDNALTI